MLALQSAGSPVATQETTADRRYKIQTESWAKDATETVGAGAMAAWKAMTFETPLEELECGESTLCIHAHRNTKPLEVVRITRVS